MEVFDDFVLWLQESELLPERQIFVPLWEQYPPEILKNVLTLYAVFMLLLIILAVAYSTWCSYPTINHILCQLLVPQAPSVGQLSSWYERQNQDTTSPFHESDDDFGDDIVERAVAASAAAAAATTGSASMRIGTRGNISTRGRNEGRKQYTRMNREVQHMKRVGRNHSLSRSMWESSGAQSATGGLKGSASTQSPAEYTPLPQIPENSAAANSPSSAHDWEDEMSGSHDSFNSEQLRVAVRERLSEDFEIKL